MTKSKERLRPGAGGVPWSAWLVAGSCLLVAACNPPMKAPLHPNQRPPVIHAHEAVMPDGYRLPVRHWSPVGTPQAILLALHGFNDYSQAFGEVGPRLAKQGIVTYAYDQRGFGATAFRGLWPGEEVLTDDARTMAALLAARYPELPLYLLGESMGGAVVMTLMAEPNAPEVAGVILVAPAVWGRSAMHPLQRGLLWLGAHTLPGLRVSGAGLRITASDNAAMLQALRDDPLVMRETRLDAVYGIVNLMDRALDAAPRLTGPSLILYGAHDEIIPRRPTCRMIQRLPDTGRWRLVYYPTGYHMLTRDNGADRVLADIGVFIGDTDAALPSGYDTGSRAALGC